MRELTEIIRKILLLVNILVIGGSGLTLMVYAYFEDKKARENTISNIGDTSNIGDKYTPAEREIMDRLNNNIESLESNLYETFNIYEGPEIIFLCGLLFLIVLCPIIHAIINWIFISNDAPK